MSCFERTCRRAAGVITLILFCGQPNSAGEPIRLTEDGRLKASPMFSQDGSELVFAVLETPKLYRLMRMELADQSIETSKKRSLDRRVRTGPFA